MSIPASNRRRIGKTVIAVICLVVFLSVIALLPPGQTAQAAEINIDSNGTKATVAASTSIKYKPSTSAAPAWNHGTFYVYFFQGTGKTSTKLVKGKDSDVATPQTNVNFSDGVAWAKVHIAVVDASSASNGGKNKRLKDSNGSNVSYFDWAKTSHKFYVWISDTGGDAGTITLPGTKRINAIYANGKTFKNVDCMQVSSQSGADRHTHGGQESENKNVVNIPFHWDGKEASQVASDVATDKGVGSNGGYITYYRMNWKQYSDGITYAGYSPYKLRHGTTNPGKLYTSINLSAVGIFGALTYKDENFEEKTGYVYRNYNTSIMCFLKKPTVKVKLDTNDGTLVKDLEYFLSDSILFKTASCEEKIALPQSGYKRGHDKSKKGFTLVGYEWEEGSNRKNFSAVPNEQKSFVPYDQTRPEKPTVENSMVTACNTWMLPAFGPTNIDDGITLKKPTASAVVYKAVWKARVFTIHYITNGVEYSSQDVPYDKRYQLKDPPSGCSAWVIKLEDGTTTSKTSGYMPAQDIYCYATTNAASTVRYHVNGKLVGTYVVAWDQAYGTADGASLNDADKNLNCYQGTSGYSSESMRRFNQDAQWSTEQKRLSGTYTQYADNGSSCAHTKTAYYCSQCGTAAWDTHTHRKHIGYSCSWCGRTVSYACYHSSLTCTNTTSGHKHTTSCYTSSDYAYTAVYRDVSYCVATTGYEHYQGSITSPGKDAFFSASSSKENIDQRAISFAQGPGQADADHALAVGGVMHKWYTNPTCTARAASTYKFEPGSCLDFYAYTTHEVTWIINGRTAKTVTSKYGDSIDPHEFDSEINTYGGELKAWYTDGGYSNPAKDTHKVGREQLTFYGYTKHKVHFWMDAGTRTSEADDDDGKKSDEQNYCLYEMDAKYGDSVTLPTGAAVSEKLTRSGCEDWATNNGRWFTTATYTQNAPVSITVTKDCTYYSFNIVKLTYDLTTSAQKLDVAEGGSYSLYTSVKLNTPAKLRQFLPKPELFHYGATVSIKGDGSVYWKTSAGLSRMASSVKGGYLTKDASGEASRKLTLQQSTTVYKNWAQSLYDGVVTH